jgi:hypothetical protein
MTYIPGMGGKAQQDLRKVGIPPGTPGSRRRDETVRIRDGD